MSDLPAKDSVNSMDVASYLRKHTDFLVEYPELAMTLEMPRAQGSASSLASYQLEVLRDKNRDLSRRLQDLIEVAHENERLMARVHGFSLGLMRVDSLRATVAHVVAAMTEDFQTEYVRFVLFRNDVGLPTADWLLVEEKGAVALPAFEEFFETAEPLCGRLQPNKLKFLFGERAGQVASAALLPVADLGMLAIGSSDNNRFHPGAGTLFLKLIGESIAVALRRYWRTP
ncbi:MAG: DUF484 family protein [Dokdonella sp.]